MLAVPPEILGPSLGSVETDRDREVHGAIHNWSGVVRVWPVGISLSHRALVTPVAGRAPCTLTHWCGWHPGWMHTVLRSSAAWLGGVSEDA